VDDAGALHRQLAGADILRYTIGDLNVRLRRGDDEFEQFFLGHFASVAASVRHVCGDAERASDATQEAFIRAYRRWNRLRDYDNPAAWVRRIAINVTRDVHRSESRRTQRELRNTPAELHAPALDPAGTPIDLLAALPDRQRAIAALYYLDDVPVGEISELLGIAEGTVRFHLSQARATLRTQLAPEAKAGHAH
jgi:RNA polymerase sigma-70 factor (ECF subfamily)